MLFFSSSDHTNCYFQPIFNLVLVQSLQKTLNLLKLSICLTLIGSSTSTIISAPRYVMEEMNAIVQRKHKLKFSEQFYYRNSKLETDPNVIHQQNRQIYIRVIIYYNTVEQENKKQKTIATRYNMNESQEITVSQRSQPRGGQSQKLWFCFQ